MDLAAAPNLPELRKALAKLADTAMEDLTADHITPLARGGHPLGPLRVLCRRCNSSRGALAT